MSSWHGGWLASKCMIQKWARQASLVAQWLRICLPMQGTQVRALVWEDPTCRGATRPVSHNYWACASGACAPQREAATVRGPRTAMKSGPRLPQLEKALSQKRRPNTAIKKNIYMKDRNHDVFYDLTLEVTHCHFCNILLVIQVNSIQCGRGV